MPRRTQGSIYQTKKGVGIRWPEQGKRCHQDGFKNRTEARDWFDKNVAPRLRHRGPSPRLTFDAFTAEYLERWGADVAPRTRSTLEEWIAPALERFGTWKLSELEGATDDVARWRSQIATDHARYKNTRALRQVLQAAVRWGYITRNPASDIGANPAPRSDEIKPFSRDELARIVDECSPFDAALITFAAETGLRTNEWMATERRDIDWRNPAVAVARRFANGQLTPYPKTSRRRVPLTARAVAALESLPPRLDTAILFPTATGSHQHLPNWRFRVWYPALEAAGVEQRGPYVLRHGFASNALAGGVSIFQLARLMGTSVAMIDRTYGHWVTDSESRLREMLSQEAM